MTVNYDCPTCDGRLSVRVQRLLFERRRCERLVVEVAEADRVVVAGRAGA